VESSCSVLEDLSPVLLRLRQRCSSLKQVELALDRPEATEDVKRLPALYLLQARDQGGPQRASTGVHTQQVTTQFDCFLFLNPIGIGAPSSKQTQQVSDRLGALKWEVVRALTGWTWSATVDPISFASGQLVGLDKALLSYQLRFQTSAQLRVLTSEVN